eukprot:290610-Chlamydomonas_euryale.AAC.1
MCIRDSLYGVCGVEGRVEESAWVGVRGGEGMWRVGGVSDEYTLCAQLLLEPLTLNLGEDTRHRGKCVCVCTCMRACVRVPAC